MMLFGNAIRNFYGTVALTTPGGGAVSVGNSGGVVIGTPATGITLTANQVTGQINTSWTDGTVTTQYFSSGGSTAANFGTTSNHTINLITNSATRATISAAGNVSIAAPSSGTALTINALTGTNSLFMGGALSGSAVQGNYTNTSNTANSTSVQVLSIAGITALSAHVLFDVSGVIDWYAGVKGSNSNWSIGTGTTVGAADKIAITTAGNVTIAAPSSGITFTASSGGADVVQLNTNHTSGVGILFNDTNGTPQNFRIGLGIGDATASLVFYDSTNSAIRAKIASDGGVVVGSATGASQGAGTLNATGVFINAVDVRAAGSLTGTTLNATVVTSSLTSVGTLGSLAVTSSITLGGNPIYAGIPQNSQSANYTLVLSDANKHIYHPSADTTARTWTIPANGSVAMPIGTAVTFDNDTSAGVITLAITTDTLVWLPTGATGSRSIAANGQATALKVTATRWHLTGVGIS